MSLPAAGRKESISALRQWFVGHTRVFTSVVVLMLLAWAFSSLVPRAWNAGQQMLGMGMGSTNDPTVGSNGDPDLDTPDIAADRVELVFEHEKVLEDMARSYLNMANEYASMREPAKFNSAQEQVARAAHQLEEHAARGASLPKLANAEKVALARVVNDRVVPAVNQVLQQIAFLSQTPGIQGDFGRLQAAMSQTETQFAREYPVGSPNVSAALVMNLERDEPHRKFIEEKIKAIVGPSANGFGWGEENGATRLKVSRVISARALADRITFGRVKRIEGRRIELALSPPTAEELARFSPASTRASPPPLEPVSSSAGGASIVGFRWLDDASDRVGGLGESSGRADGTKDQHFALELDLPADTTIEEMLLSISESDRWVTRPNDRFWPVGIYQGENAIARAHTPRVGVFSGRQTFDLFLNTGGDHRPGTLYKLEMVLSRNGDRHLLRTECRRPG
jgi:hypothetical protein